MKFVFDTSSLIILHQSALFPLIDEILRRMNGTMILLKAIEEEMISIPIENILTSFNPTRVDFTPSNKFTNKLGFGERAVIEYASSQEENLDFICVLDDLKARKIAKQMDIRFVGILGITGRGFEICAINTKKELQQIWKNWNVIGFRMPKSNKLETYLKLLTE